MEAILFALALVFIGYTVASVKIINQGEEAVVERLGKFNKKLTPGLNFIIPFLDQIVYRASTREMVLDIEPQEAITKDNVSLTVDAVVYWRILNAERTYYALAEEENALRTLVTTTLRSEIGRMNMAQTFSSRNEINHSMLQQLDEATAPWGIKVTRVEVESITPPEKVKEAMERERAAESDKKAAIYQAEGRKQAQIEGAEAIAESVKRIAEVLKTQPNSQEILRYLVAQRYVDANLSLGQSENAKVVFMNPRDLSEGLAELIQTNEPPTPPNAHGGNNGSS